MDRVLVTYATMAGSTAEVAQAVAEELIAGGWQADALPLRDVHSLDDYDAVVLGAPMIMGWHREARRFLKRQRRSLQQMPLALFVTAISLTETGETSIDGVPIIVDEQLPKPPQNPERLSFRERYARLSNYVRPILKAAGPTPPATIGIFGGRLEYGRVPWWAVLFVMFIIQAPAGDRRNWPAIRAWAAQLPAALKLETPQAKAPAQIA